MIREVLIEGVATKSSATPTIHDFFCSFRTFGFNLSFTDSETWGLFPQNTEMQNIEIQNIEMQNAEYRLQKNPIGPEVPAFDVCSATRPRCPCPRALAPPDRQLLPG